MNSSQKMLDLMLGRWVAQAIGAAARLDFADLLADGPLSPEALAQRCGAQRDGVFRLLRALASCGVFCEVEGGNFANTPLSEVLRRDVPGSMRGIVLFYTEEFVVRAWSALVERVRSGEPQGSLFDWFASHPAEAEVFQAAMSDLSAQESDLIAASYDFSRFSSVTDVGGGHGALVRTLLDRFPTLRGRLFDLPHVVRGAIPHERLEVVGGSFLDSVPPGSDAFLLKHILHDWSDEHCLRILSRVREACGAEATLLVVDGVVEPGNEPHFVKLLDLEMLALTPGGRERSREEWVSLLARGGFALREVIALENPFSLLVAVPV